MPLQKVTLRLCQTSVALIFKLKSSLGSQIGKSVFSYFFPKNIFYALSSCHPAEKQNKADTMLNIENVFTREELHL